MGTNRELNPYAPPREDPEGPSAHPVLRPAPSGDWPDYGQERRSVALCVLLSIVTCGFYPMIWLLQRRPFLERLQTALSLSAWMPAAALGVQAVAIAIPLLAGPETPLRLIGYGGGAIALIATFRAKNILAADLAHRGRGLRLSGAATFFFGVLYLQSVINREADRPPPEDAAPRRHRRRKKRRAAAPADHEPQAGSSG